MKVDKRFRMIEAIGAYLADNLNLKTLDDVNKFFSNALNKPVDNFWKVSDEDAAIVYQSVQDEIDYMQEMAYIQANVGVM